jgi:RecA-family ATPase
MGETLSATSLARMKFSVYHLSPKWINIIGLPERNFRMLIWEPSGSGKTTLAMELCKELASHGKVYLNSVEQGKGKSLQDLINRVGMGDCAPGSFVIGNRDTYDEMVAKLKKNRAMFVVIDSAQYINLTTEQYKHLIKTFPKKAFIIISWEQVGGAPKGEHAKAIRYMVDVKTYVKNGIAKSDSRIGPTQP